MPEQVKINLTPCESSQIHAHGYDHETKTLALQFKHKGNDGKPVAGSVYYYSDFSPETYADFCAAESKGSFFGKRIKNGGFNFTKIVPVKVDDGTAPEAA